MKPHVICHMVSSVDGRILPSRWRPEGRASSPSSAYTSSSKAMLARRSRDRPGIRQEDA